MHRLYPIKWPCLALDRKCETLNVYIIAEDYPQFLLTLTSPLLHDVPKLFLTRWLCDLAYVTKCTLPSLSRSCVSPSSSSAPAAVTTTPDTRSAGSNDDVKRVEAAEYNPAQKEYHPAEDACWRRGEKWVNKWMYATFSCSVSWKCIDFLCILLKGVWLMCLWMHLDRVLQCLPVVTFHVQGPLPGHC